MTAGDWARDVQWARAARRGELVAAARGQQTGGAEEAPLPEGKGPRGRTAPRPSAHSAPVPFHPKDRCASTFHTSISSFPFLDLSQSPRPPKEGEEAKTGEAMADVN